MTCIEPKPNSSPLNAVGLSRIRADASADAHASSVALVHRKAYRLVAVGARETLLDVDRVTRNDTVPVGERRGLEAQVDC